MLQSEKSKKLKVIKNTLKQKLKNKKSINQRADDVLNLIKERQEKKQHLRDMLNIFWHYGALPKEYKKVLNEFLVVDED